MITRHHRNCDVKDLLIMGVCRHLCNALANISARLRKPSFFIHTTTRVAIVVIG